jgi:hypothetical protein
MTHSNDSLRWLITNCKNILIHEKPVKLDKIIPRRKIKFWGRYQSNICVDSSHDKDPTSSRDTVYVTVYHHVTDPASRMISNRCSVHRTCFRTVKNRKILEFSNQSRNPLSGPNINLKIIFVL